MSDSFSIQYDNLAASLNTVYRLLQAGASKKDIMDEAKQLSLYYGKIIGILMARNVKPSNIPNSEMNDIINLRIIIKQLKNGNSRNERQKQDLINSIYKILGNIERLKQIGRNKALYSKGGKRKTHKRHHTHKRRRTHKRRHTRRN
jgi:hypothetical protein